MKKKRTPKGATRPVAFHPNSTCIGYSVGETDFIVENVFTPTTKRKIKEQTAKRAAYFQDPNIPAEYKLSPSYYFRDQIARCIENTDSGKRFTDEVVKYVVQGVRQLGVDALQLNEADKFRIHPLSDEEMAARIANFNNMAMELLPATAPGNKDATGTPVIQVKRLTNREEGSTYEPEDSSSWISELEEKPVKRDPLEYLHPLARAQEEAELFELRYREGLGPVICDVLRFWREQIERGSLKQRRLAAKHLHQFGEALMPETRGKRAKTLEASHYEVKKFYLKELYRLYHIDNAVRSSSGPRNHRLRVKEASENYGLSVVLIREFWGLDEDDSPDRQPLAPKDMARELTARQFNIKHQTVSNILSS